MYLIPEVKYLKETGSFFLLSSKSRIVFSPRLNEVALQYGKLLQESIKNSVGLNLIIQIGTERSFDIYFALDEDMDEQQYTISIKEENIYCYASSKVGILYAIQTLRQIISQEGGLLPTLGIKDCPDFMYRGYYLDQSRGRVLNMEYYKKLIDKLSYYKINQLQLYIEHTYLFNNLSEMWRDETPLTAKDIMELDSYANSLNVELVPSLSSFGHLYTLLNTKSFNNLCEMDRITIPFSFHERMNHHTVNVSDDKVLPFIEDMIEEYMKLFTSDKFNFCCDETFDLGKGKSKALCDQKGVHRIYIDYVKALSEFIVSKGKIPMFWGDIICGSPELVKELPEQIICLNWGYAPEQNEEPTKKMASTGVKQYLCPGVCGWNQWMPLIENSFKNITRMCNFAQKYKAIGILNTDWGDFGHINDPRLSIPGLIYGANFSWNNTEISFNEMNKRISKVEYMDNSEKIVSYMNEISKNMCFDWCNAVFYYEHYVFNKEAHYSFNDIENVCDKNTALFEVQKKILEDAKNIDSSKREIIELLDVTAFCVRMWNICGSIIKKKEEGKFVSSDEAEALACKMEAWFMKYKALWRTTSREGDLKHVGEIIFWYCDLLRDL